MAFGAFLSTARFSNGFWMKIFSNKFLRNGKHDADEYGIN